MKQVKVLGGGCSKCDYTVGLIEKVAREQQVTIQIEKIQSPAEIVAYGVMSTPAVVVDEQVVHAGSIPTADKIAQWLQA